MTKEELRNKAENLAITEARNYKTVYSEDYKLKEVLNDPLRFDQDFLERLYLLMKEKHYRDGFSDGHITGYEKGLEEGSKLEYHDLLKNPNDLPGTNREVLVLLWDYDNYHIGRYEEEYDDVIRENTYWHFDDFSIEKDKLDTVLGWFELPKVKR